MVRRHAARAGGGMCAAGAFGALAWAVTNGTTNKGIERWPLYLSFGVIVVGAILYAFGYGWFRSSATARSKSQLRLSDGHNSFISGYGDAPRSHVWLMLRATNHGRPTVLTDWAMQLYLDDDQPVEGDHMPYPQRPEHVEKMAPPLDAPTARKPFAGEATGWVAFWVPASHRTIVQRIESGEPLWARVSVLDQQGTTCETRIDLAEMTKRGVRHFGPQHDT